MQKKIKKEVVRTRRLELPRDLTPTRPSTWRVYQFRHVREDSDLAGARTQDPLLKREMLYQLSYQVEKSVTWLGLEPRTLSLKGRCSTN